MEQFFVFLYPLVIAISIAAYIPQIRSLLFATSEPKTLSLSSWGMWCISSFLAFGYALVHIHDFMLFLTAGLNLIFVLITTALIIYNKHLRFKDRAETLPIKVRYQHKK